MLSTRMVARSAVLLAALAAPAGLLLARADADAVGEAAACPAPSTATLPCVVAGSKDSGVQLHDSGDTRIATLALPAGRWALVAKVTLSSNGTSSPADVGCTLTAGTVVDQSYGYVASPDPTLTSDTNVTLAGAHVFRRAGSVQVSCNDFSGTGGVLAGHVRVQAVRAGTLTTVTMS